jgi:hypothetical protein
MKSKSIALQEQSLGVAMDPNAANQILMQDPNNFHT